jgi:hypothetical protein
MEDIDFVMEHFDMYQVNMVYIVLHHQVNRFLVDSLDILLYQYHYLHDHGNMMYSWVDQLEIGMYPRDNLRMKYYQ